MRRRSGVRRSRAPGPATTRVLAVGLPVAAFAIGAGAERSRACRAAVLALAVLAAASGVAVAVAPGRAGARPRGPRRAPCPIRRLIVLIPARDEAVVIGAILGDLAAQEPLDAIDVEIVVIDDRSTDGTGDVASAAIAASGLDARARVVRRASGGDGKGAALASVPVPGTADTALVVLDADARVEPWFLARCAAAMDGGADVVTARRRMLRPAAGASLARLLAEAQDHEQLADERVQRARRAAGGASELRGDGMVVRAALVARLGGWAAGALCEDLDLSTRAYLLADASVDRLAGLDVWEQPVLALPALVRQRIRWAEGLVRRDLSVVLPAQLDAAIPARRRLDALAYAAHALVPWLAAGLVTRAVRPGAYRTPGLAAELAGGYAVAGLAVALATTRDLALDDDEPRPTRRTAARRIVGTLALQSLWLVALPVGWLRTARRPADPRFVRTSHAPSAAFERSVSQRPRAS